MVSLMADPGPRAASTPTASCGSAPRRSSTTSRATRRCASATPPSRAAVASISSPPLRNMGTIGGNLCVDTRCTYYNQTEDWRRSIDYCMKEEGDDLLGGDQLAALLGALGLRLRAHALRPGRAACGWSRRDGERVIPLEGALPGRRHRLPGQAAGRDPDRAPPAGRRRRRPLPRRLLEAPPPRLDRLRGPLRRRGPLDRSGRRRRAARGSIWAPSPRSPLPAQEAARLPRRARRSPPETIAEAARLARKAATPMDNTDFQAQWRGKMVEATPKRRCARPPACRSSAWRRSTRWPSSDPCGAPCPGVSRLCRVAAAPALGSRPGGRSSRSLRRW